MQRVSIFIPFVYNSQNVRAFKFDIVYWPNERAQEIYLANANLQHLLPVARVCLDLLFKHSYSPYANC